MGMIVHCLRVCVVFAGFLPAFFQISWGQTGHADRPPAAISPPDWAYPVNPPDLSAPSVKRAAIRVPHSAVT
jgi:hypothetical protein